MATQVDFSFHFQKRLKKLARKYPTVVAEVEGLVAQLKQDERSGDQIPEVGYEVYKVRLRNPSASKGKSGGFRVIYYVEVADRVIMVEIYTKSDQSDIAPEAIQELIEELTVPEDDENDEEAES